MNERMNQSIKEIWHVGSFQSVVLCKKAQAHGGRKRPKEDCKDKEAPDFSYYKQCCQEPTGMEMSVCLWFFFKTN